MPAQAPRADRFCALVLACASAFPAAYAGAQITYTSRTSTISSGQVISSNDFLPFNRAASGSGEGGWGNHPLTWSASTQQLSSLGAGSFTWSMTGDAVNGGSARNTFIVDFTLTVTGTYSLVGENRWEGSTPPSIVSTVLYRLNSTGGVASTIASIGEGPGGGLGGNYSRTGGLTPGSYRLTVREELFTSPMVFTLVRQSGTFTVTPAPGAAGAMVMAACAVAGRRRR